MEKNLYIDASHPEETRIVLKSNTNIEEYESENSNSLNIKSNIYLGKVSRVEPSLQAAFINYGRDRHGFLAFNDIQSDYYQIPTEVKEELQKTEEKIREDLKEKTEDNEIKTPENFKDGQSANNNVNESVGEDKDSNTNRSEEIREKLKNRYGVRKYRIQEVIKPGQVILVQVIKEERGQKGAALTTFISLAGKYIV